MNGRGSERRSVLWRWRRGFFVAGLLVMVMVAGAVSVLTQVELPEPEAMQLSSYICAADVELGSCGRTNALAKLSAEEDRDYVTLDQVSQDLVNAVIAAEDREFFEHQGIDPVGIGRALYHDLRAGGLSQGGSTITQQLVKYTRLTSDRTITRKLKETVLAIKIEKEMTKEEILEAYLNNIYFGRNAYGIQAASQAYFRKNASELGVPEASYLAGLIRAPGLAEVEEHPDEAARRRSTVLDAMLAEGYIDQAQYDLVEGTNLVDYVADRQSYQLRTMYWGGGDQPNYGAEYVADYVEGRVERLLKRDLGYEEDDAEREIQSGGLRVYTTLSTEMQAIAYDVVYREVLTDPNGPSGSLVALDDQGMIRAMVGGRDFRAENDFAQNNLAVLGRPVGSTFKPIALAEVVSRHISLERSRLPAPPEIDIPDEQNPCDPWSPSNYSDAEVAGGRLNLVDATRTSSNTVYAQIMAEMTAPKVIEMAQKLGMDSLDPPPEEQCLPIVLGARDSTALEMAEVYSTFANRGTHQEPAIVSRIDKVDQNGDVTTLWEWAPNPTNVLTPQDADLVTHSLRQVIDGGTGQAANIGKVAAGKTGTTQNYKNAWFVGYVPRLTAAVWMGYPVPIENPPGCDPAIPHDPQDPNYDRSCAKQVPPMRDVYGVGNVTGGSLPAQIWKLFMERVTAGMEDEFTEPTPEDLRCCEVLGQDAAFEREPPGPPPSDGVPSPRDTRPTAPPTSETSSSITTPSTTLPDPPSTPTSEPLPTIPDPPGGGGGGGGGDGG